MTKLDTIIKIVKGEKMDLEVIGAFISSKRKEKKLTQLKLAQQLNISEKTVSKWECGKGFPDTSLILPLCRILGISANELLSGKKLEGKEYMEESEQHILNLLEEKTTTKKRLTYGGIITGILLLISLVFMYLVGFIDIPDWLKITIIILSFIILIIGIIIGCQVDITNGTFECRHCHKRFKPSVNSYVWGVHSITTRYLKCPYCGKRSFCKKRLTSEPIEKNKNK